MVSHVETPGYYIVYTCGDRTLKVWKGDLVACAFVAADWHGGQWSTLYRLSCGEDYSYNTVVQAYSELALALAHAPTIADDDESYDDARSALETLNRIDFDL